MKIDFKNIEEKIVPNFKGGEGRYIMKQFADEKVKIMYGKLEPGCSIGLHRHELNCEIMYILSGQATYVYEGQEEIKGVKWLLQPPQGVVSICVSFSHPFGRGWGWA